MSKNNLMDLSLYNSSMNKFIVTNEDEGRTLLKYLQRMFINLPLSRIERALREKDIKVNDERVKDKNVILTEGDEVVIYGIDIEIKEAPKSATRITFGVVYEDANILVVNKPNGLSMHSDNGSSLDSQVFKYLDFKKVDSFMPASIGRIDKVTSGLVIYGKNYQAVRQLNDAQNEFVKEYQFKSDFNETKIVTLKLSHDEGNMKEIVDQVNGKDATTKFFCNDKRKIAQLVTGRKHQIRVTLEHLGAPILGDTKYGGKRATRVFLHSWKVVLSGLEGSLAYLNGKEFTSDPGWI